MEMVSATGTVPDGGRRHRARPRPAREVHFTIQVQDADGNALRARSAGRDHGRLGPRTLVHGRRGPGGDHRLRRQLTATASYGGLSGTATASAVDGEPVPLDHHPRAHVPVRVRPATARWPRRRRVDLYHDDWGLRRIDAHRRRRLASSSRTSPPASRCASSPTTPRFDVQVTLFVTVPHGQSLTDQVLRMWSAGSMRGRVQLSNGTGLGGFEVVARYTTSSESEGYRYAYTDANGEYLFDEDSLPVGTALRISTHDPVSGSYREVTATIDTDRRDRHRAAARLRGPGPARAAARCRRQPGAGGLHLLPGRRPPELHRRQRPAGPRGVAG